MNSGEDIEEEMETPTIRNQQEETERDIKETKRKIEKTERDIKETKRRIEEAERDNKSEDRTLLLQILAYQTERICKLEGPRCKLEGPPPKRMRYQLPN